MKKKRVQKNIAKVARKGETSARAPFILRMEDVGLGDVARVGGKNASLGEMIRELKASGIRVPSGVVITTDAYRHFIREASLEGVIKNILSQWDKSSVESLEEVSEAIRTHIREAPLPKELEQDIADAYARMERQYGTNIDVAIRSSATAEDLSGASFAGGYETYIGIRGKKDVLRAVRNCYASLFTARAVFYRHEKGFDHLPEPGPTESFRRGPGSRPTASFGRASGRAGFDIALSVAIQRMVRTDKGASGVMFTIDTETGFPGVLLINAAYGLGELVVQGQVIPDEYLVAKELLGKAPSPIIGKSLGAKSSKMVYAGAGGGIKPVKIVQTSRSERSNFVLSDKQILKLAEWGNIIERHYTKKHGRRVTERGRGNTEASRPNVPMDIEWGLDGKTGELFILQARPETVQVGRDQTTIKEYILKEEGPILARGFSVGNKIVTGKVRVISSATDMHELEEGEVLVTEMTDPDWEPIMKKAVAIVTDKGGRTSHAAIVSRELGLSAVVGAEPVTKRIRTGQMVTVDTTGSEGKIYAGKLHFEMRTHNVSAIPKTRTKIMMNIATPDTAFEKSFLPNSGVGLAREEFIIAAAVGVHPLALLHYKELPPALQKKIDTLTRGWTDRKQYYIDKLAYGIAKIATAFYPKQVIVRFSDFKSNEYRSLLGGELFEPHEENPMLGWRGASRYYDPKFREAFTLECMAMRKVRERMGLANVVPMVPFCRTLDEGKKVLRVMAEAGLRRGLRGLKVIMMCEIPSNAVLAEEFLELFDGMSIGSNDLTQLSLGLDRDSGIVNHVADENDPAVKKLIAEVIAVCTKKKKYVGICGQGPSDHPKFAEFLVHCGIESMSLNPDTVIKTTLAVAKVEQKMTRKGSGRMGN